MSLFFTVFFLLYSLLHAYVFLKAWYACPFGLKTGLFLAVFMVIMILAPVIVRLSEKGGHEDFAGFAAYTGYIWMATLFMFFTVSVCMDIGRLCLYIAGYMFGKNFSPVIQAYRHFFIGSLICALSVTVYGYFEAGHIKTERLIIKTQKIPETVESLKIAQISDVHLGLTVTKAKLERVIREIRKENPAILVSTGDLVDGQTNRLNGFIELLKTINPPYGKYAILGNHEFYAGIQTSLDFLEKTGFTVLRGTGLTVAGAINIAGVDDITGRPYNYMEIDEKVLLSGLPKGVFTLLLKHRPIVNQDATGLFDLQLSGHTHMGQIFPFRYVVKLFFSMDSGYFKLSDTGQLYVNRGTGTWGPPIRVLAPPEVTIVELVRATDGPQH